MLSASLLTYTSIISFANFKSSVIFVTLTSSLKLSSLYEDKERTYGLITFFNSSSVSLILTAKGIVIVPNTLLLKLKLPGIYA